MNAPTALIPLVEANPSLVLIEPKKFDRFYDEMKRETDAHVPDLTTAKGRKDIASLAFRVAKTKTAIEEAGKLLKADALAKINTIDAARRTIRDRLDALRDEVRAPLTEWEKKEAGRVAACDRFFDDVKAAQVIGLDDTAETVSARAADLAELAIVEERFAELHSVALVTRDNAVAALHVARDRFLKEEAGRAELERLRAEAAEREAKEREAAEAKVAAEAAERQRAETEAREKAAEEAAKARVAAAAKAAEDAARLAAEAKANEERVAQQSAHDEALAAEKRRFDEAEAARKSEADRLAAEKAEAERRAADVAHRSKIMGAAKQAIMGHGVGESTAKAVVLAIAAGDVPNVSIRF